MIAATLCYVPPWVLPSVTHAGATFGHLAVHFGERLVHLHPDCQPCDYGVRQAEKRPSVTSRVLDDRTYRPPRRAPGDPLPEPLPLMKLRHLNGVKVGCRHVVIVDRRMVALSNASVIWVGVELTMRMVLHVACFNGFDVRHPGTYDINATMLPVRQNVVAGHEMRDREIRGVGRLLGLELVKRRRKP